MRCFSELGKLYAVCDKDENAARTLAEKHQVPSREWESILADTNINAVVIATPAVSHAELVEQALSAGKHVFVEKPIALNVDEAVMLHELAASVDRVLMVGHLMQYHPVFLKLKDMMEKGELGKLRHIYSHRLNFGKIRKEENILWSFAPHDISMILSLVGSEPRQISAMGGNYLQPNVTDVTTTQMNFSDGVNAHVFVSWLHPYKEQKLVLVGEDGMVVFDDTNSWGEKLVLYSHAVDWQDGMPVIDKAAGVPIEVSEDEPLGLEAKHFLECIDGKTKCRTDGSEAIRVLRVLQASERALIENRVIDMNEAKDNESFFNSVQVHHTACIDEDCSIGENTRIWHFSHVLQNSKIGRDCTIGQNVMIGPGVEIGDSCKIQNNVSVYQGVTLKDGVFCGPSCVFTNVINPRAKIEKKNEFRETLVGEGASIGANATILCGIEIGEYAFVAAGAVVSKDVQPYSLVVGVPARHAGWVCRCGENLAEDSENATTIGCSSCMQQYRLEDGQLSPEN